MGILDDILGNTAAKASKQAAAIQAGAATSQKASADRYQQQALRDQKNAQAQASSTLKAAEAAALRYRQQAGQQLTASEQQQLAEYDAAEQAALQRVDAGQAGAMGALDTGESDALGSIAGGRTGAINALYAGRDAGLSAIDAGGQEARDALSMARADAEGQFSPYAETGAAAQNEIAALQGLLGPEAQQEARARFQTDPGYAFRVQEGINALDKSATARGGLYSGAAMKALNDYAQGQASQEYGNYYNRTADIANTGFNAASNLAQLAAQFGTTEAELAARLGLERSGLQERTGQGVAGVEQTAGAQSADVQTGMATNRANAYQGFSQLGSGIASDFGQLRGAARETAGINRANVLTGSGDLVMSNRTNQANALLGGADSRNAIRGNALAARTDALGNYGNALAAGTVGAANAKTQGVNNLLSLGGTIASAAMGAPKIQNAFFRG